MKGLLAERGDRDVLAAFPEVGRIVLALTRRGTVNLGTTPGGAAHYLRYVSGGLVVRIESWRESCLEDGVLVEWDELDIEDVSGSIDQYVEESEARTTLPPTDPDGPLGRVLRWEGWWKTSPRAFKRSGYEFVSIQVWDRAFGVDELMASGAR